MQYTVKSGDTLTAIVARMGLCSTNASWDECIQMAEYVANGNGIPWGGPPDYSAPIWPGMVITLPDAIGPQNAIQPAGSDNTKWLLIGGFVLASGLLIYLLSTAKD